MGGYPRPFAPGGEPMKAVLEEIANAVCPEPRVWWLGGESFAFKHHDIVFYINPQWPADVSANNADMVLCTHIEAQSPASLLSLLADSAKAKVVLPKSRAEALHAAGVPYDRMTTTDSDLRVEYFKHGAYGRVYSIPSSRDGELDWTPIGGFPRLGYLIRFGKCTIYHAGACAPYEGQVGRLLPYAVTLALMPVSAGNFEAAQAAQLAHEIGAKWVAPMGCDAETASNFTLHMLGHRPSQRFKIFERGEGWTIPGDDELEAEGRVS